MKKHIGFIFIAVLLMSSLWSERKLIHTGDAYQFDLNGKKTTVPYSIYYDEDVEYFLLEVPNEHHALIVFPIGFLKLGLYGNVIKEYKETVRANKQYGNPNIKRTYLAYRHVKPFKLIYPEGEYYENLCTKTDILFSYMSIDKGKNYWLIISGAECIDIFEPFNLGQLYLGYDEVISLEKSIKNSPFKDIEDNVY